MLFPSLFTCDHPKVEHSLSPQFCVCIQYDVRSQCRCPSFGFKKPRPILLLALRKIEKNWLKTFNPYFCQWLSLLVVKIVVLPRQIKRCTFLPRKQSLSFVFIPSAFPFAIEFIRVEHYNPAVVAEWSKVLYNLSTDWKLYMIQSLNPSWGIYRRLSFYWPYKLKSSWPV